MHFAEDRSALDLLGKENVLQGVCYGLLLSSSHFSSSTHCAFMPRSDTKASYSRLEGGSKVSRLIDEYIHRPLI